MVACEWVAEPPRDAGDRAGRLLEHDVRHRRGDGVQRVLTAFRLRPDVSVCALINSRVLVQNRFPLLLNALAGAHAWRSILSTDKPPICRPTAATGSPKPRWRSGACA